MARKPAVMYRRITGQAYTRKKYMGGIPNPRINQYDMGNLRDEFPVMVSLKVTDRVQVRHNSLDACRIAANRVMNRLQPPDAPSCSSARTWSASIQT